MKPILFNTEMVQAILDGRKTTTRRIIKVNKDLDFIGCSSTGGGFDTATFGRGSFDKLLDAKITNRVKSPYMPGDILYVRETWMISNPRGDFARHDLSAEYYYKAGFAHGERVPISYEQQKDLGVWKPSIHMPKKAARIFLRVTSVRVERLQDLTEEGIRKEGAITTDKFLEIEEKMDEYFIRIAQNERVKRPNDYQKEFKKLWNSTVNKKDIDNSGWNANPWVWVIKFERCEKPNE